jgi:hypothetical protein
MCGGDLVINKNLTVGTCKYCGSTMTLPTQVDEIKVNLFNRANHYRLNNEYDNAAEVYKSILNQDSSEAEAFWGLVLCKYGVEYVEDPGTHKRVPTCHRTQFGSILTDADYKAALENADVSAKKVYQEEAESIDEIQKQILTISNKEDSFDVFICYKENNEAGTRTEDSVLAQDLYYQLKKEGYKVFFSRITLEHKLGSAYEPYIFAALNSAKVMVVIATKPEYVNAVWVKNEWNRYLALIRKGEEKTLIPAYKGMSPYDLPEEFSYLQALDMTRLGFMQDLLHGIRKLVVNPGKEIIQKDNIKNEYYMPSEDPLIDRAFLCLEDGDFEKADELIEQTLNINPRSAKAYIGKLMVNYKIRKEVELGELILDFSNHNDYKKAVRFSDKNYKKVIKSYLNSAIQNIENARKEEIYQKILFEMRNTNSEKNYIRLAKLFMEIVDYKDSSEMAKKCENLALKLKEERFSRIKIENEKRYSKGLDIKNKATSNIEYNSAENYFRSIIDYKDSKELADECRFLSNEYIYKSALKSKAKAKTVYEYEEAQRLFRKVYRYKDASAQVDDCEHIIFEIKKKKKLLKSISIAIFILLILFIISIVFFINSP